MKPQIILAGNDFSELGWDGACHLAANAASNNQGNLALVYIDMMNRVEFGRA